MTVESLLRRYFPYSSWRRFQREIAETVYDGLAEREVVIIEAPTGIGKTSAVLAGALAYAEETDSYLAYLVRTKSEAQAPVRELLRLRKKSVHVPFVVIRSRLDMCCLVESKRTSYEEFLEECRYLRSHGKCQYYIAAQKVDIDDVYSQLMDMDYTFKSFVSRLCAEGLCPYEVAKRLIERSRVIIMTYHYLFSLNLADTIDLDLSRCVLLIDEAHNLPHIITDANSFSLSELVIRSSINEVKKYVENEEKRNLALQMLKNMLSFLKKLKEKRTLEELERSYVQVDPSDILSLFENIDALRDVCLEIIGRKRASGAALPTTPLLRVLEFHKKLTKLGSNFTTFVTCIEGVSHLVCKCLDPAIVSSRVFSQVDGCVLMSGTMPPTDYIQTMLGIERRVRELRIPFRKYVPKENIRAVIYTGVTTRYVERSEDMFEKIGNILSKIYRSLSADKAILAVFPSYAVLKAVRKHLSQDVKYIMELSSTSVESIIESLQEDRHQLIMAVAGGKLMEGVEFKIGQENVLGMVVIVGVPYPEPNDYLNMFMNIVSMRVKSMDYAWELTYLWSALVKIKQAIGRAIRSERDRAYILLMDRRFLDQRIRRTMEDYLGELKVIHHEDDLVRDVEKYSAEVLALAE